MWSMDWGVVTLPFQAHALDEEDKMNGGVGSLARAPMLCVFTALYSVVHNNHLHLFGQYYWSYNEFHLNGCTAQHRIFLLFI